MTSEKLPRLLDRVPDNMKFIFKDPDTFLLPNEYKDLVTLAEEANNLVIEKDCRRIYSGLIEAAVYWLKFAYNHSLFVNQSAYDETIKDLEKFIIFAKGYDRV